MSLNRPFRVKVHLSRFLLGRHIHAIFYANHLKSTVGENFETFALTAKLSHGSLKMHDFNA